MVIKSKMSLSQSVTKAVDEVIHIFMQQIANKYDLDPSELLAEWEGGSPEKEVGKKVVKKASPKKSSVTDIPSASDDIDQDALLKQKKPELQALCRQRGVKCTGTKAELIGYLLGKESSATPKKAVAVAKKASAKKTKAKVAETPVAKKLTAKVPTVAIRRNQFNNHEHPESSLIFDKKSKKVIGKQNDDGTIEDLTSEDIDLCHQYKFEYTLPDNLDKKARLEDVQVDELDELDDEEEDEVLESDVEGEDEEEVLLDEDELVEDDDFEEEEEFEEEFADEYE